MTPIQTAEDCLFSALTEDGREVHIVPLTFGRARIGIGPAGSQCFDDVW